MSLRNGSNRKSRSQRDCLRLTSGGVSPFRLAAAATDAQRRPGFQTSRLAACAPQRRRRRAEIAATEESEVLRLCLDGGAGQVAGLTRKFESSFSQDALQRMRSNGQAFKTSTQDACAPQIFAIQREFTRRWEMIRSLILIKGCPEPVFSFVIKRQKESRKIGI